MFVHTQLLYHHWSKWTNFYKSQPLDHVRKYFGEKVGIYFTWVGKQAIIILYCLCSVILCLYLLTFVYHNTSVSLIHVLHACMHMLRMYICTLNLYLQFCCPFVATIIMCKDHCLIVVFVCILYVIIMSWFYRILH